MSNSRDIPKSYLFESLIFKGLKLDLTWSNNKLVFSYFHKTVLWLLPVTVAGVQATRSGKRVIPPISSVIGVEAKVFEQHRIWLEKRGFLREKKKKNTKITVVDCSWRHDVERSQNIWWRMQSKNSLVALPNNHRAKEPGSFFSHNRNFPFKNHDLKLLFSHKV